MFGCYQLSHYLLLVLIYHNLTARDKDPQIVMPLEFPHSLSVHLMLLGLLSSIIYMLSLTSDNLWKLESIKNLRIMDKIDITLINLSFLKRNLLNPSNMIFSLV